MAATAYLLDAARRLTCAGIDQGHKPAVVTAIMKAQATERLRVSVNDAMDVHGGKAVQEGPLNYLGSALSRGAGRHHGRGRQHRHPRADPVRPGRDPQPSLPAQGNAGARGHRPRARPRRIRQAFWAHVGHSIANACRAWGAPGPAGCLRRRPTPARRRRYYRQLGALCLPPSRSRSTSRLLTLGGALKRREMISARFGDILSELYLLSAVLKRWQDEGRQEADLPLVEWCMESGPRHHRDAVRRDLRQLPEPAGGVAVALHGAAAWAAPSRAVRRADAAPAPIFCSSRRRRATASRSHLFHGDGDDGPSRCSSAPSSSMVAASRCATGCARRTCATSARRARRA